MKHIHLKLNCQLFFQQLLHDFRHFRLILLSFLQRCNNFSHFLSSQIFPQQLRHVASHRFSHHFIEHLPPTNAFLHLFSDRVFLHLLVTHLPWYHSQHALHQGKNPALFKQISFDILPSTPTALRHPFFWFEDGLYGGSGKSLQFIAFGSENKKITILHEKIERCTKGNGL